MTPGGQEGSVPSFTVGAGASPALRVDDIRPYESRRGPSPRPACCGFAGAFRILETPRAGEGAGPYNKNGNIPAWSPTVRHRPREAPCRRGQSALHLPTGGSRRDRAASAYEAPDSEAGKPQVLRRRGFSRTMGP